MCKFGNSDSLRLRPALPPQVAVPLSAAVAVVSSWDGGRVKPISFFQRQAVLGEADRKVGSEGCPKRKRKEGKMKGGYPKLDADFRSLLQTLV